MSVEAKTTKHSTASRHTGSNHNTASRNTASRKTASHKTASRKKASRRMAARSGPPRQATPTQERYAEIQQALAAKGYYKGEVTGQWNAESVDALKRFQTDEKLNPDGKIGARSLISLGLGPKRDATIGEVAKPNEQQPQGQQ